MESVIKEKELNNIEIDNDIYNKTIFQILLMVKISIYINKHLQILVKTNMDLQERQEEALDSNNKQKYKI